MYGTRPRTSRQVGNPDREAGGEWLVWPLTCSDHDKPRTLWCETCRGPVCLDCRGGPRCGNHLVSIPEERGGLATRVAMPSKMARYWVTRTALLNKIVGRQVGARPVVTWSGDQEDALVDGTYSAVRLLLDTLAEEQETAKKGLVGAPARLAMKEIKKKREERDRLEREKFATVFGLAPKPEKKKAEEKKVEEKKVEEKKVEKKEVEKKKGEKKKVVKKAKTNSSSTSTIKIVDGVMYGSMDVREENGGTASARGGPAGGPGDGGMVAGPEDNLPEEEEQVGQAGAAVTDERDVPGASNWALEMEEQDEQEEVETPEDPCRPATSTAPARRFIQRALPELSVPAASIAEQERLRDAVRKKEEDKRKKTQAETKKNESAGTNAPEAEQRQEARDPESELADIKQKPEEKELEGTASARGGPAGGPGHGVMGAGPGANLPEEEEQVEIAGAAVADERETEDPETQRENLEDPSEAADAAARATETQETGDPEMEVRRARAQFLERICLKRKLLNLLG